MLLCSRKCQKARFGLRNALSCLTGVIGDRHDKRRTSIRTLPTLRRTLLLVGISVIPVFSPAEVQYEGAELGQVHAPRGLPGQHLLRESLRRQKELSQLDPAISSTFHCCDETL